jgi:tetratricopeptide (TPR) repeat protein
VKTSCTRFILVAFLLGAAYVGIAEAAQAPIVLRDDLAVYSYEVSTESEEAQRYFDQGLVLYYGFNHRTVALSALGRVDEARAELAALKETYDAVPESRLIGNNTARTVLEVGLPLAEGELEYRRGNVDRAFDLLREAVKRDVALRYDEPWGWMMPVRHALGALLLEQGRVEEAEAVYRADLELHPGNGWALQGLAECLRRTGRADEAASVDARSRAAWTRADITITASCYCRRDPQP